MWNVEVVRAVQGLGDWLLWPMRAFSLLGEAQFFLLLVTLVYWSLSKPLGIDMAVLLLSAGYGNNLIKAIFKQPRPFWIGAELGTYELGSFSLPSGHAQSSAAVYGAAAYALLRRLPPRGIQAVPAPWRKLLAFVIILVILSIAFSRVYLGAHFPGDALLGLIAGIATVALYHWFKPRVVPRLRSRSLLQHAGLAFLTSVLMIGLTALAVAVPGRDTGAYAALYANGLVETLYDGVSIAAAVFGLWLGAALEQRLVRFDVRGEWWRRLSRYLFGLAGTALIYLGSGSLVPGDALVPGLVLSYVRYALVMLWVICLWPWLFVRLGLARREGLAVGKPGMITRSSR